MMSSSHHATPEKDLRARLEFLQNENRTLREEASSVPKLKAALARYHAEEAAWRTTWEDTRSTVQRDREQVVQLCQQVEHLQLELRRFERTASNEYLLDELQRRCETVIERERTFGQQSSSSRFNEFSAAPSTAPAKEQPQVNVGTPLVPPLKVGATAFLSRHNTADSHRNATARSPSMTGRTTPGRSFTQRTNTASTAAYGRVSTARTVRSEVPERKFRFDDAVTRWAASAYGVPRAERVGLLRNQIEQQTRAQVPLTVQAVTQQKLDYLTSVADFVERAHAWAQTPTNEAHYAPDATLKIEGDSDTAGTYRGVPLVVATLRRQESVLGGVPQSTECQIGQSEGHILVKSVYDVATRQLPLVILDELKYNVLTEQLDSVHRRIC
eukprot:PhM_4_TR7012/c0_g1_i2/m.23065